MRSKSLAAIGTVWVSNVGVKIKDSIEGDSEKNGGRKGSSAPPSIGLEFVPF